jgi:transposase-like protein
MSTASRVRKRLTQAQRERILSDYRGTRLSQRDFARQAGIGVSTLQLWLRKAADSPASASSAGFVEVPNPLAQAPGAAAYRLRLVGGIDLEIASGFRAVELLSLLGVLRGL